MVSIIFHLELMKQVMAVLVVLFVSVLAVTALTVLFSWHADQVLTFFLIFHYLACGNHILDSAEEW